MNFSHGHSPIERHQSFVLSPLARLLQTLPDHGYFIARCVETPQLQGLRASILIPGGHSLQLAPSEK